jgi:hypothetical protein
MGSAATDVAKGAFDLSAQQERCERGHRHDSRAQTERQRRERLVGMQEAVTVTHATMQVPQPARPPPVEKS